MDADGPTVLVVEPFEAERDRLAAALEDDGFLVMLCPGPSGPDASCIGTCGGVCPLTTGASVVVLDMSIGSDEAMLGTPAEDLLGMYLERSHPVVALDEHRHAGEPGQLISMRRHPDGRDLVAAVRSLSARTAPATRS